MICRSSETWLGCFSAAAAFSLNQYRFPFPPFLVFIRKSRLRHLVVILAQALLRAALGMMRKRHIGQQLGVTIADRDPVGGLRRFGSFDRLRLRSGDDTQTSNCCEESYGTKHCSSKDSEPTCTSGRLNPQTQEGILCAGFTTQVLECNVSNSRISIT